MATNLPANVRVDEEFNRLCATPQFLALTTSTDYWVSADRGTTWELRPFPGLGRFNPLCTANAMWVSNMIATGNQYGVQKTEDGKTWSFTRLSPAGSQEDLNSTIGGNGEVMITRRVHRQGVEARLRSYKSNNGGGEWAQISDVAVDSTTHTALNALLTASGRVNVAIVNAGTLNLAKTVDISSGGADYQSLAFGTPNAQMKNVASTENYSFFNYYDANLRGGVYRVGAPGEAQKVLAGIAPLGLAASGRNLLALIRDLNSEVNINVNEAVALSHPRLYYSNDEGETWWDISQGMPRLSGENRYTAYGYSIDGETAYFFATRVVANARDIGLWSITQLPRGPGPISGALSRSPRVVGASLVASGSPGVSRGHYVSIYGENLSSVTRTWSGGDFVNNYLPGQLDNLAVTIRGNIPTYPVFVSPTQINVFVPSSGAPTSIGRPEIQLTTAGGDATFVSIDPFQPNNANASFSFFRFDPQNRRYIAAVTPGGEYLGPVGLFGPALATRPARSGEIITYFVTGVGREPDNGRQLNPAPVQAGPNCPIVPSTIASTTLYFGLISPGVYQCNMQLGPNLVAGEYAMRTIAGGSGAAGSTLGATGYLIVR